MSEVITGYGELSGICGHDGNDWEKVLIDAAKRLVVAVAAVTGEVEVIQDTPGDLNVSLHGYDGAAWRKSNLLWGYNDRYYDRVVFTSAGGTEADSLDPVPAGYVYFVEYLEYYQGDSVARVVDVLAVPEAGASMCIKHDGAAAGSTRYGIPVGITMKEGDYLTGTFRSMNSGKTCYLEAWGYIMKVDM